MATKSRRRTTRGRNHKRKKQAMPEVWNSEVFLLAILGITLFMCISNFGVGGAVGNWISNLLFGCFGTLAYIFPICIFLGTAFKISNPYDKVATIKLIAAVVFFVFLCFFLQLVVVGYQEGFTLTDGFTYGVEKKAGGGFVGGLLARGICPNFGLVGAYVVDIVMLIICLVLITERSFLRGITNGGKKVYSTAREDASKRRENAERKRKEAEEKRENKAEQELRRNKKVLGVAKDTKIRGQQIEKSENLAEIILPESIETFEEFEEQPQMKVPSEFEPILVTPARIRELQTQPELQFKPEIKVESEPVCVGLDSMTEVTLPFAEEVGEIAKKSHHPTQTQPVKKEQEIEQSTILPRTDMIHVSRNNYELPPISLLKKATLKASGDSEKHLRETANKLQQTLQNFGVKVTITNVSCGPSVTRYELQPEQGVKVSKIVGLTDDIKLNLAAADIRIEAPIPGKAAVGIEVPNKENVTVMFRDLIESDDFKRHSSNIAFAAGKDIGGKVIVADIMKMPHLLIAGATGSGKSVCINTIIMSILYKANPEDVKLIMIDPKVVELSVYNGIPHLFIPVVTDPKKAAGALHWAVAEMSERYQKFAQYNVRDLKGYNQKVEGIKDIDEEDKPEKLPQIVIIVDELADLMMVAPGEVEDAICRLAQLARAAGIHLIIATQRPSVNVITGLIKANMPSRIAFSVSSGIDSRTILDMNGAEKLLGKGDMLFYPQGYQKPLRVQGAFVSDQEVADVVEFFQNQQVEVAYNKEIEAKMNQMPTQNGTGNGVTTGDERDAIFMEAGKFIIEKDKASIGMLQRYFKIGFNRAARIMDQLSDAGVVGPEEGTKPRKVLMSQEEFEGYIEEYV